MGERAVVTCFLRHGTEVLLVRRRAAAGTSPGRWAGVSGSAEGDPEAAARREIDEEVGLLAAATVVRSAEPRTVRDRGRGTEWHVHPFLVDCDGTGVEPNEAVSAYEWVQPAEILQRDTVPDLWATYRAVAPTVESVATDAEHGSAYVSLRALEVLRDAAGEAAAAATDGAAAAGASTGDVAPVLETAADLRTARPAMGVVRTRIDRVVAGADDDPASIRDRAIAACERAVAVDDAAAAVAADRVGDRVLTLSRSGTVLETLRRAAPEAVFVAESRPDREGVGVAVALADAGLDATLCVDAAVGHVVATEGVDTVLVGADTVLADGTVVNKVGTRTAAVAAADAGADCYAVCATDKVSPATDLALETGPPDAVHADPAGFAVHNPTFEATPAGHFTGIVTAAGVLSADDVASIAAVHAAREPGGRLEGGRRMSER
jgi:translation initiation factor 2B subunit (eIF-2B alpha/beta/delta family)/ADP-ribose pyrophosphatase YjhB (NUDIX family)